MVGYFKTKKLILTLGIYGRTSPKKEEKCSSKSRQVMLTLLPSFPPLALHPLFYPPTLGRVKEGAELDHRVLNQISCRATPVKKGLRR